MNKALQQIAQMSDSGSPELTILRMKEIAVEALKEQPNKEQLNEAAEKYADKDFPNKSSFEYHNQYESFKSGAEWQLAQFKAEQAGAVWEDDFKEWISNHGCNHYAGDNWVIDETVIKLIIGYIKTNILTHQPTDEAIVWNIGDKFTTPETGDKIFTVKEVMAHDIIANDERARSGETWFAKSYIKKANIAITDEAIALMAEKEYPMPTEQERKHLTPEIIERNIQKQTSRRLAYIRGFKSALNNKSVGLDEDDLKMLREFVMRGQFTFPETEQDMDWFNQGMKGAKTNHLFIWVNKKLNLGNLDLSE